MLHEPRDIGVEGAEKSVPLFEPMLAEYYALRKWDPLTGAIDAEVLKRLGLPQPVLATRQLVAAV
jgi:aldehyde:ferredoxin oxidoreductase